MPKPRANKNKTVKNKLWIYTEGTKTEQTYINGYIKDKYKGARNKRVESIVVPNVRQNTADSLVKRIKSDQATAHHKKGDIYWVAYDRESVSKYPATFHDSALSSARGANINVAISCVCIEQYLLWHFNSSQASYTSYDNLISRSNLTTLLNTVGIAKYEKGDDQLYEKLKSKVDDARRNAARVNAATIQASQSGERTPVHQLSPYSDFYKILDAIDQFVQAQ
ncbi:RloB family protein [Vibrio alginolyticus]|nr:RloB domain-containing protein [Vibrio alginolyticus]